LAAALISEIWGLWLVASRVDYATWRSQFCFWSDHRKIFEPAAQIICENESAAPALHGAKLAGSNCLVDGGSARVRDLAGFTDVVGKLLCEH
jgi:hypothetical protein